MQLVAGLRGASGPLLLSLPGNCTQDSGAASTEYCTDRSPTAQAEQSRLATSQLSLLGRDGALAREIPRLASLFSCLLNSHDIIKPVCVQTHNAELAPTIYLLFVNWSSCFLR